jgi:hypothetical protein
MDKQINKTLHLLQPCNDYSIRIACDNTLLM